MTRTDAWVVSALLMLGVVGVLLFAFWGVIPDRVSKDARHMPRCLPAQDDGATEAKEGKRLGNTPCPPTSYKLP